MEIRYNSLTKTFGIKGYLQQHPKLVSGGKTVGKLALAALAAKLGYDYLDNNGHIDKIKAKFYRDQADNSFRDGKLKDYGNYKMKALEHSAKSAYKRNSPFVPHDIFDVAKDDSHKGVDWLDKKVKENI